MDRIKSFTSYYSSKKYIQGLSIKNFLVEMVPKVFLTGRDTVKQEGI